MPSRITSAKDRLANLLKSLLDEDVETSSPVAIPRPRATMASVIADDGPRAATSSATPAADALASARKRPSRNAADPGTLHATKVVDRSKQVMRGLFDDVRMGRAIDVARLGPVVDRLSKEVDDNAGALLEVIRLKNKSEYTYLHSVSVSTMMLLLGRQMGYRGTELTDLGLAGLLHDIGKMGVSNRILEKPDRLTDIEFSAVKAHPALGHGYLLAVTGLPQTALDVCLCHHEKMDGTGYPFGYRMDRISIAARMGAVCDVYDALTSDRPYKQACPPREALAKMRSWQGHFDKDILALFMQALGIFPKGSLVSVRGRYLGIVIEDDCDHHGRPLVRTFYSIERGCFVAIEDVAIGSDGVLSIEEPAAWPLGDWTALADDLRAGRQPTH